MTTFKTIGRAAAACSLTLLAAGFAHAQSPIASTGSTDIYTTDFQTTFPTGSVVSREPGTPAGTGSIDLWTTNFQRVFATDGSVRAASDVADYHGSIDIWTTNFQRMSM